MDRWFGTQGSAAYYRYRVTSDGAIVEYGNDPADYATSVVGGEAISFIRETPSEQPLFAYISVPAPHDPAIAAPGDEGAFKKLEPWRPPATTNATSMTSPGISGTSHGSRPTAVVRSTSLGSGRSARSWRSTGSSGTSSTC